VKNSEKDDKKKVSFKTKNILTNIGTWITKYMKSKLKAR
jgi:hypothetical protein